MAINNSRLMSAVAILVGMSAAILMTEGLRPNTPLSNSQPSIHLDSAIPTAFGEWELDATMAPIAPSPDVERRLDLYYQQTIGRTYLHRGSNSRVMLSIAYGITQSRELQVHRPEVCYSAQGFSVSKLEKVFIKVPGQSPIPAMRLIGVRGNRIEPLTYWIRFGRDIVRGNLEQGFSRLKHGLNGEMPDALLFRVSSLDIHPDEAYRIQDVFVADLLHSLDQDTRRFIIAQP